MIKDKRMTPVKSENGINYWLFKPSILSLYYNDKALEHDPELSYRKSLTHKLHMIWYLIRGQTVRKLKLSSDKTQYAVENRSNKHQILRTLKKKAEFSDSLGGYRILYLEQKNEILSYIAFVKANKRILKDCGAKDYYTIFLWTCPAHRGKGLATLMAKTMLNELSLDYKHFYKTILDDNTPSICVAEKSGFHFECETVKTGKLRTIQRLTDASKKSSMDSTKYRLYVYNR